MAKGKVNIDKMNAERDKAKGAGDFYDFAEGETCCYVCPPAREDDDMPYWELKVHYGMGSSGKGFCACLDPSTNPIISNPAMQEQLKALKKKTDGGCPVCEGQDEGKLNEDFDAKSKWLWIFVPMKYRKSSKEKYRPTDEGPVCVFGGWQIWDGTMDVFGQNGDITDPDAAVLARVTREGTGKQTGYDVQSDVESVKNNVVLDEELRGRIDEAMQPGGPLDPYRILASMFKSRADVLKQLDGDDEEPEYEEGDTAANDTEEESRETAKGKFKPPGKDKAKAAEPAKQASKPAGKDAKAKAAPKAKELDMAKLTKERGAAPSCFKVDPDAESDVCQACPWKVDCAEACGVPVPPDPAGESEGGAESLEPIEASAAVEGQKYLVDGKLAVYKGPAKGLHYFTLVDGGTAKAKPGDMVEPVSENGEVAGPDEDEDADLAQLKRELAAKAAKTKGK